MTGALLFFLVAALIGLPGNDVDDVDDVDDVIDAAAGALSAGDIERAIELLEPLAGNRDMHAQRLLARAYVQSHRFAKGIEIARNLDVTKASPQDLIDLAEFFAEHGLTLSADLLLSRSARSHSSGEILLTRAYFQYSLAGYDAARDLAEQALAQGASDRRVMRILALIEGSSGNAGKAIRLLEKILAQPPGDPELFFQLGRLQLRVKTMDAAIDSFWNCLELNRGHVGALLNLANVLVRSGRRDEGTRVLASFQEANARAEREKKLRETVRINPGDPRPLIELAEFLVQNKRPREARTLAARVRFSATLKPRALAVIGLARDLEGKRADARAALTEAVTLDGTQYEARLRLAEICLLDGELSAAAVNLRLCKDHSSPGRWHLAQGELAARAGQGWEGTAPHLERAVNADPTNLEAVIAVVDLARAFGRVAEAEGLIESWRTAHPKNPRFDIALGVLSLEARNFEDARSHLERAIEKDPWLSASHAYSASAFAGLGEQEKSRRSTARAKQLRLLE